MTTPTLNAILDIAGFSFVEFLDLLRQDPDLRVQTRFQGRTLFRPGEPAEPAIGVVLDTETTSKHIAEARIVELGMVKFLFDRSTHEVYRVLSEFGRFKDPGMPISAEATAVNHITDDMVAGHLLPEAEVNEYLQDCSLVIAHNSRFDRPVCEREYPVFASLPWACSWLQVPWPSEGMPGKLEYIAARYGFFFEAHRAQADCLATLECLDRPLPVSGQRGLHALLSTCHLPQFKVYALDAAFDHKDTLKQRGYAWHAGEPGQEKAWGTVMDSPDALEEEIGWLRTAVYRGQKFRVRIDLLDAYNRFSERRNPQPHRFC